MIVVFDVEGKIILANHSTKEALGFPQEQIQTVALGSIVRLPGGSKDVLNYLTSADPSELKELRGEAQRHL